MPQWTQDTAFRDVQNLALWQHSLGAGDGSWLQLCLATLLIHQAYDIVKCHRHWIHRARVVWRSTQRLQKRIQETSHDFFLRERTRFELTSCVSSRHRQHVDV